MKILEIGAGGGNEALWLTRSGACCTCVEINPKSCVALNRKLKKAGLQDTCSIVRADAQNLPFRRDLFDVVFCKAVLHHLKNPLSAIMEMTATAKKNGKVVAICEPNASNPLWHLAKFLVSRLHIESTLFYAFEFTDHNIRSFYPWELRELFRKANLGCIKSKSIWLPYSHLLQFCPPTVFNIWLAFEKIAEITPISYVFGQLIVVSKKLSS